MNASVRTEILVPSRCTIACNIHDAAYELVFAFFVSHLLAHCAASLTDLNADAGLKSLLVASVAVAAY